MKRTGDKGTTMIELMIAIAAGAAVMVSVMLFLSKAQQGLLKVENMDDLALMGQRASKNLRQSVEACQRMFCPQQALCVTCTVITNAVDTAYFNLISASATSASGVPDPVPFAKPPVLYLPTVSENPPLCLSSTASTRPFYGDCLAYAAASLPVHVNLTVGASVLDFGVDAFQFVAVYLAQPNDVRISGIPGGRLSLVEWRSVPVINYNNLAALSNANLSATAQALVAKGYTLAWDPTAAVAGGFYTINATPTFLVALTPTVLATQSWCELPNSPAYQAYQPSSKANLGVRGPIDKPGGTSGLPSNYSVAFNTDTRTPAALSANLLMSQTGRLQIPMAADASAANGFPAGFEVMISGNPGGREMCGFLTLMASSAANVNLKAKGFTAYHTQVYASYKDTY